MSDDDKRVENINDSANQKVEFEELIKDSISKENEADDSNGPNLDLVFEIPVRVSMEVGHTNISVKDLLKLTKGSVIELDRYAGDPLDVFVNGKLIAHGEVVVVNEQFGIRITDVVNNKERLEKLKAGAA